jgi:hypothetical protein
LPALHLLNFVFQPTNDGQEDLLTLVGLKFGFGPRKGLQLNLN